MPVNNPNFGTGAVDWGNYVNANQQTTDRDRGLVQSYLAGQPSPNQGTNVGTGPNIGGGTVAQSTHVQFPQAPAAGTPAVGPRDQGGPGAFGGSKTWRQGGGFWSYMGGTPPGATPSPSNGVPAQTPGSIATPPDWGGMTGALATPGGFEQDLGAATHPGLVTPYGSPPANGPTATSPGAGNGFDAALEGQSASSLYSTPAQQSKAAIQAAAATPIKAAGPIQSAPVIKAQGQASQQAGQAGTIASDNWRKYLAKGGTP